MADIDNYIVADLPEDRRNNQRKSTPATSYEASVLPANIDAEKTILGAVLLDNNAYLETSQIVQASDFMLDSHERIFKRMGDILRADRTIDIVTLSHELSVNKEIEAIGGVAYLASLTEGLPRRPVIEEYIRIVKDKAMLRRLMLISSETIARAADQSEPALEVAGALAVNLQQVIEGGMERGLRSAADLSVEVMDRFLAQSIMTSSPGFSFGISSLDEVTGGIMPGEQTVIGAYSSVGKTTLLAQIVAANCPKGHPMALFLYEPTRHSFLRQLWAILARVPYQAVTKPWLATKEHRERLMWAEGQVMEWPLYINDISSTHLDEQIAQTRMAMQRFGVELTAIDYIQRMKIHATDKFEDTRLRIGRASTENANLVKNTKNRTLILSQLKREGGLNQVPTMDKLRETGQLENDAATILLLHLKFDQEKGHFTNEGAGIIAKQRFGVPRNVKLKKDPTTALWCDDEAPTKSFNRDDDDDDEVAA